MEIKNDIILEDLCLYNTNKLYRQLKLIDWLTRKEEVSTLVDTNRNCLIINRCVHPNIFVISYDTKYGEKEIVITERELYES